MDLQALHKWFFNNVDRINTAAQGAYWTLKRDHGRTVYSNLEVKEPQDSWAMLEQYIMDQARNGARQFEIQFKLYKTDPAKTSWQVQVPYGQQVASAATNNASINGLNGANMPAIGQLYHQMMADKVSALEEKHQMQIKALEDKVARDREMERMEEMIEAIQEEKKNRWDKLLDKLEENPTVLAKLLETAGPTIQGVVASFFPRVAVQGPQELQEVPVNDAEQEHEEAEVPSGSQVGIDFNPAIQALINLQQSGEPDGGDKLLRLVDCYTRLKADGFEDTIGIFEKIVLFASKNPEQANMLLNQLG